jgi:hypothetical protein
MAAREDHLVARAVQVHVDGSAAMFEVRECRSCKAEIEGTFPS